MSIQEKICTCKHEPKPEGAEVEQYICVDCGGIADGWYWPELNNR